jgi:hypothetical protein
MGTDALIVDALALRNDEPEPEAALRERLGV